jgi:endonuclease YncB( thermonuclease family)
VYHPRLLVAIYALRRPTQDTTSEPSFAPQDLPVLVGTVTKIVDGDTIDVDLESGPVRIRLHAVDTPEKGQPWGSESTAALTSRVLRQTVDLEPFEQDVYERLIATVLLGETNINAELVRQGHAWAFRKYMRKVDAYLCKLEHEARTAKRGLWSLPKDEIVAPWEWRRRKSLEMFTDYSSETVANCVLAIGKG